MIGTVRRLEALSAPVYLTAKEASETKLCENCYLPMSFKQINLTEAIRQCSNCSFSLSVLDKSSVEFVRRSYKDIRKDPKEWTEDIGSEEQEVVKLKAWVEDMDKNLNKFDNDDLEEAPLGDLEDKFKNGSSDSVVEDNNARVLAELEDALVAASFQKSNDDDFPFPLDDIFAPINSSSATECAQVKMTNNTENFCSYMNSVQGAETISQGKEASINQLICSPNGSAERMQIIEEEIIRTHDSHSHASLGNPPLGITIGNTSEQSSPVDIPNENRKSISDQEQHESEVSMNGRNHCGSISDQTSTLSASLCTTPKIIINEESHLIEEISSVEGLHSSCTWLNNSNKGCKTYSLSKSYKSPKQPSCPFSNGEASSSLPFEDDPYQISEPSDGNSCTLNVPLPELNTISCMPEVYQKSQKRKRHVKLPPSDMEHLSIQSSNPSIGKDKGVSTESCSVEVSIEGGVLLLTCPNQSDDLTSSELTCPSLSELVMPCSSSESIIHKTYYSQKEKRLINMSCEADMNMELVKRNGENSEHLSALPSKTGIVSWTSACVEPSQQLTSNAILITIPATEDISQEFLQPINIEDIIMYDDIVEFPAITSVCAQSSPGSWVVAEDSDNASWDQFRNNTGGTLSSFGQNSRPNSPINNMYEDVHNSLATGETISCQSDDMEPSECSASLNSNNECVPMHTNDVLMGNIRSTNCSEYSFGSHIERKLTHEKVISDTSYLSYEEDDKELVAFSGAKFKPKPGTHQKVSKKYSDILGSGKYVNFFNIIQNEIKDFQPDGDCSKQTMFIIES